MLAAVCVSAKQAESHNNLGHRTKVKDTGAGLASPKPSDSVTGGCIASAEPLEKDPPASIASVGPPEKDPYSLDEVVSASEERDCAFGSASGRDPGSSAATVGLSGAGVDSRVKPSDASSASPARKRQRPAGKQQPDKEEPVLDIVLNANVKDEPVKQEPALDMDMALVEESGVVLVVKEEPVLQDRNKRGEETRAKMTRKYVLDFRRGLYRQIVFLLLQFPM